MNQQSSRRVRVPGNLLANPVVALALAKIEVEVIAVSSIRARPEHGVEDGAGCLLDR
jgi:hypothetical protein